MVKKLGATGVKQRGIIARELDKQGMELGEPFPSSLKKVCYYLMVAYNATSETTMVWRDG
jgi:hypothetical protein